MFNLQKFAHNENPLCGICTYVMMGMATQRLNIDISDESQMRLMSFQR